VTGGSGRDAGVGAGPAGPGAAGRTAKGGRRREQVVRAAVDLVREEGPGALSHRAVAQRAGVPLAATTYYVGGLDDLAAAAGAGLVDAWVAHAEQVLARSAGATDPAGVVVEALLPPGDDAAVAAHYELLLAARQVPALAAALRVGRDRLDAVLAALLAAVVPQAGWSAPMVLAVLDGAVVAALSEGRPVRPAARVLLAGLLADPVPAGSSGTPGAVARSAEPGPAAPSARPGPAASSARPGPAASSARPGPAEDREGRSI
jgi:TetR/AcrR family transcriptional regulator, regulator of biofilm formation and stress response